MLLQHLKKLCIRDGYFRTREIRDFLNISYLEAEKITNALLKEGLIKEIDLYARGIYGYTYTINLK